MQTKKNKKGHTFIYGDQFEEDRTPLFELLSFAAQCEPNLETLQEQIRQAYFQGHGSADNSGKMAMNCRLSMKAYGLVEYNRGEKTYVFSGLGKRLLAEGTNDRKEMLKQFGVHILTNLHGLTLLRMIETIRARGEEVTLEYLGEELNTVGLTLPPNSTYISTMTAWLARAEVISASRKWDIRWDVVYDLLRTDANLIDKLYRFPTEQKYFLLSALSLCADDWIPSNKIAEMTRSRYAIRLTTKNLVKDVLEPLETIGLLETQKATLGRGAKPHNIRLTAKGKNELLVPLLNNVAGLSDLTPAELNRTFEDVVSDLKNPDKHVKGKALELLAIWIIRLLGLRFSKWRAKDFHETGGGEVDVIAASDHLVYSRWQIQCKNQKSDVDVDVIAKEVGMTFLTRADVIMVVTTGDFTSVASDYANQVTELSRYYIILLDGEDINRIVADRTKIIDILNIKARRVFAKRELGITEFGNEIMQTEEELELEDEFPPQGELDFGSA